MPLFPCEAIVGWLGSSPTCNFTSTSWNSHTPSAVVCMKHTTRKLLLYVRASHIQDTCTIGWPNCVEPLLYVSAGICGLRFLLQRSKCDVGSRAKCAVSLFSQDTIALHQPFSNLGPVLETQIYKLITGLKWLAAPLHGFRQGKFPEMPLRIEFGAFWKQRRCSITELWPRQGAVLRFMSILYTCSQEG